MVAPLETTAARQVLNFRLPRPAAASLRLTVPGDVELKSGADVISRTVDKAARQTRFELLPRDGRHVAGDDLEQPLAAAGPGGRGPQRAHWTRWPRPAKVSTPP